MLGEGLQCLRGFISNRKGLQIVSIIGIRFGKLLEGSPISAADIAGYIYDEVAKGEFMILPHEQGRVAWAIKRQNPQIIYDEMTVMCEKMRAKLGAS